VREQEDKKYINESEESVRMKIFFAQNKNI
jgi:hypothetical protein